jgi:hypothetical protein
MGRLARHRWHRRLWGPLALVVGFVACGGEPSPEDPSKLPPQPGYYPQPTEQPVGPPPPAGGDANRPELERQIVTEADAQSVMTDAESEIDTLLTRGAVGLDKSDRCSRLCAALASMARAVDSLCRMSGDDDERCVGARTRLENSRRRVTDAGCAC